MHDAIALTCLVAARIEPRPWLRPSPPPPPRCQRRWARVAFGSLLTAIGGVLWRAGRHLSGVAAGSAGGVAADHR